MTSSPSSLLVQDRGEGPAAGATKPKAMTIRPHGRAWPTRGRLYLRLAGAVVMVAWLGGLVHFSTVLYGRNYLSIDFGVYNQAWSLIGHGHLNPLSTLYKPYPFVKSDFELILWPLALLHLIDAQPIVLLWVQDAAVAASGFAAYLWIADYLEERRVAWWPAVGVCTVVLAVVIVNPGVYQTLLYDFHIEPISTVFVLLAGRDLWSGRTRRVWIWIALALSCGTFAAITLVGLGISALMAGSATRRAGATLIVVAVAWLGLISLIGANAGSGLDTYAYLAGRTHLAGASAIALIFAGIVVHPSRMYTVVFDRLHYVWLLIESVGVIGLASAWGFGVPAVVMFTNIINANVGFIAQAYQNSAVFSFLLVGTVMALVWLAQRLRWGWIASLVVGVAVSVLALVYGIATSPADIRWATAQVTPARAAALTRSLPLIPPGAEVIATDSIIGRFSARPSVHWFDPKAAIPVSTHPVVFVFDPANENIIPYADPADDVFGVAFARDRLGARVLLNQSGVTVLQWQPRPGTKFVVFPAAPGSGPPTRHHETGPR